MTVLAIRRLNLSKSRLDSFPQLFANNALFWNFSADGISIGVGSLNTLLRKRILDFPRLSKYHNPTVPLTSAFKV
jgi:hypothetical protein